MDDLLAGLCASAEAGAGFDGVDATGLVSAVITAGSVRRRVDAVLTGLVGEVADRDRRLAVERVSPGAGCRDVTELLRRALRTDVGTARGFVRAARVTHREVMLSSGELGPAAFPAMAEVLRDGVVSVAGLLAAVGPVQRAGNRITAEEREVVDGLLARTARGEDLPDEQGRPGPAPSTGELADFSRVLMLRLDPDGAEPEDRAGERNRGVTFGSLREGVVPIRGGLLPETAAQLQRLFDAVGNPAARDAPPVATDGVRFTPADPTDTDPTDTDPADTDPADTDGADAGEDVCDGLGDPVDERTPAQKRHDALAMIVTVAAASGGFPDLGGAAPTLVVSVTAEDYVSGTGRARLEGTGWDVPVSVARHTACAGGVQRVLFDERGQIVSIGTTARVFTAVQRRAIVLRDRECVIPGCHVPATWCEIHHVHEHARGGRTHTSNGVALCWHHHRTLDVSGWQVRMRHGVPEIRGPHWWDPHRGWHRPRTHHGTPPPARTPAHALAPPG
ncbi:DUF222 domain-containing protein [Microbacterium sp. NPDC089698]|uniref:HNH endonuclease signature motif containing protein n=1 Tax=Microbacterium sp. NPDC089698 TaxID=3364200 RepID=UPI00382205A8